MNRNDFQALAEIRIKEAKSLLDSGFPEGAYYLAGYSVECALKACIAKRTQQYEFPDKKLANDIHTHDLGKLLDLARLKDDLDRFLTERPEMEEGWDNILEWSEIDRYKRKTKADAEDLLKAIEDNRGGLLPWLRQRW